jgi:hypothetical protein
MVDMSCVTAGCDRRHNNAKSFLGKDLFPWRGQVEGSDCSGQRKVVTSCSISTQEKAIQSGNDGGVP